MSQRISIAGVSERDLDLLLLEEFQSSPTFQDWFVRQGLGLSNSLGQCVSAQRSVKQSAGESDLEIVFADTSGKRTLLMIENKVGAGLQHQQAKRYILRGDSYVTTGHCSAYHAVIVAPARYFGETVGHKGFGSRVTYEQILEWFVNEHSLGERRHYKAALLRSAIEKGTLGYQPEEDAPTTHFWRAYWHYARELAPQLEMKEPTLKPSGSGFIYFRPPSLPRGVEICHKFNRGFVDLQFNGLGNRLNEVHQVLGKHFDPDMQLTQAAKSAAIRLNVPVLKPTLAVDEQAPQVRIGLEAATRLQMWFLGVQGLWRSHLADVQP